MATRARQAGQQDLAASNRELQEFDRAQASLPTLADLRAQRVELETQRHEFEARRTKLMRELDALVESSEATVVNGAFAPVWSEWTKEAARKKTATEAAVSDLEHSFSEKKTKLAQLHKENVRLSPLLQARSGGRFWTLAWWMALLKPAETRRAAEIAQLILDASSRLEQQEKALATANLDRQLAHEETTLERTRLLDEERIGREKALSAELGALEARNSELTRRWLDQCRELPALTNSAVASQEDLARASQNWARGRASAQASALRAEQWLALLDRHPHALRDALIEHTPLIAATAAGWTADRGLADRLSSKPFDLLILEEAEQFAEAECAAYARLARPVAVRGRRLSARSGPVGVASGRDGKTSGCSIAASGVFRPALAAPAFQSRELALFLGRGWKQTRLSLAAHCRRTARLDRNGATGRSPANCSAYFGPAAPSFR